MKAFAALLEALVDHARPIARSDRPTPSATVAGVHRLWRGRLVAVLGSAATMSATPLKRYR